MAASSGIARPVGSLFSPLDHKLELGTEGYSPSLLRKAVRQAAKAVSFKDASEDLHELAGVSISPTHLQRLSERIGREWLQVRDGEVAPFQERRLPRDYPQAAAVAAVMLDAGRYQTRADNSGRGVSGPAWKESKVAYCQTYAASPCTPDPQPRPPRQFLDRVQVARLAAQMAGQGGGVGRAEAAKAARPGRRRRACKAKRPRHLVRTVVATTADKEAFGWQVVAEVHRRGLDQAARKACLGDGC